MKSNGQPNESGRCSERGCVYPATAGSPKGYCRPHALMFEGDWPIHSHSERNVTMGSFKLDRPGNSTRHAPRPAHA